MTAAELRSRISRSGVSGTRLARLLGIRQPNVSRWCTGMRPIPAHHVPAIIRLTDNPPSRTEPAWSQPQDMPAGRSQGWRSKASRQRRAARAERPAAMRQQPARWPRSDRQPVQFEASALDGQSRTASGSHLRPEHLPSNRPAKATAVKPAIGRPQPAGPSLDLSALVDLVEPAGQSIGGNGANGTLRQTPLRSLHRASTVTAAVRPVASVASLQRASDRRQVTVDRQVNVDRLPGAPEPPGMAGPLH